MNDRWQIRRIQNALNYPLIKSEKDYIKAGNVTQAVGCLRRRTGVDLMTAKDCVMHYKTQFEAAKEVGLDVEHVLVHIDTLLGDDLRRVKEHVDRLVEFPKRNH